MRRAALVVLGFLLSSVPASADCTAPFGVGGGVMVLGALQVVEDSVLACCTVVPIAVRPDPGPAFVAGCAEYVLKYGGGAGTQGSYEALDLSSLCPDTCGGTGASGYRCAWVQGIACCVDSGTCVPAEVGNLSGPTASGIQSRFAADTDQREAICFADYHGNGARLVTAFVTDAPSGSGSGVCHPVRRRGVFFLTRIPTAGSTRLISCSFIGYADSDPTPVSQRTWGSLKLIYR
jgi:hypothetical protein